MSKVIVLLTRQPGTTIGQFRNHYGLSVDIMPCRAIALAPVLQPDDAERSK